MTYDRLNSILDKVTACVSRKFSLGQAVAEDCASRGFEYSLRYFLENNIEEEWDEKDLFSLACWKACNLDKDGFSRHNALSDALGLDAVRELDLSPLRREVFRNVYLEECRVAEVCSRLGITPNYAYGIVFGVKKGVARVGPAILATVIQNR